MRVCDQEDRDKVLALNRQTVAGCSIKFEVDEEASDQKRTPTVGVVKPGEVYVVKAEGLSAEAIVKDFQKLFPTVKEVRLPIAQAGKKRITLLDFGAKEEAGKIVSIKQGIILHKQPLKLEVQKSLMPGSALPS
ncbi:uncharacterized protein LOC135470370 isoform X1 [Liolophura sinensis]|uniref:uncharacterized protein LOC135470370 isoform X1 n=1 Tax=Liolophura sinensis TaxID=3198878 RepID=UPI003158E5E0